MYLIVWYRVPLIFIIFSNKIASVIITSFACHQQSFPLSLSYHDRQKCLAGGLDASCCGAAIDPFHNSCRVAVFLHLTIRMESKLSTVSRQEQFEEVCSKDFLEFKFGGRGYQVRYH